VRNPETIDQIRDLLGSPDPRVRRRAARAACPCHGSFDMLRALRTELRGLADSDPDPQVRAAAEHVLSDAIVVNVHEQSRTDRDHRRDARTEQARQRAAIREQRSIRRARRADEG
jgi:hypothetical protein